MTSNLDYLIYLNMGRSGLFLKLFSNIILHKNVHFSGIWTRIFIAESDRTDNSVSIMEMLHVAEYT